MLKFLTLDGFGMLSWLYNVDDEVLGFGFDMLPGSMMKFLALALACFLAL
jgi:hypothetical protein